MSDISSVLWRRRQLWWPLGLIFCFEMQTLKELALEIRNSFCVYSVTSSLAFTFHLLTLHSVKMSDQMLGVGPHQACEERFIFIGLFGTFCSVKNTEPHFGQGWMSQSSSSKTLPGFKWSVNEIWAKGHNTHNVICSSCLESLALQNDVRTEAHTAYSDFLYYFLWIPEKVSCSIGRKQVGEVPEHRGPGDVLGWQVCSTS